MDEAVVVAVVVGVLQGVFEWLPISSEGNVAIALTALGSDPAAAVQFALFLHAGTALSATVYYRSEVAALLGTVREWRARDAFEGESATLSFLALATLVSVAVGLGAYAGLEAVISTLTGGAFVAAIGALLVATGVVQRLADDAAVARRSSPTAADAVLVGALQGLAILPGVSRSGTTVSALLLRGHDGEASFRLSFLLSVPAALGAGVLAVLDTGGLPSVAPAPALLSLGIAAVVGYLTIDALMRVVRGVAFWAVCVALGGLAVAGGLVVAVA